MKKIRVVVNRARTSQEALDATGCKQYINRKVLDSMPKGEGDEVEVVFFKPDLSKNNGYISDDDLQTEFELRGLKPSDPISLAKVNEDYTFAYQNPNGTHWKNVENKWCFIAFHCWGHGRDVVVNQSIDAWAGNWLFAGFPK